MGAECPNEAVRSKMQQMLTDPKETIGLIVCEKFANFPPVLLAPLNRGLADEISWAVEDEPTAVLRKQYKFTKYIKICCAFEGELVDAPAPRNPKKRKKQPKREVIWKYLDDELMAGEAMLSYGFRNCIASTEASTATSRGMAQRRHVLV